VSLDLAVALKNPRVDPARIVEAFLGYIEKEEGRITRALFERNLAAKVTMPQSAADIGPILAPGYAWDMVSSRLIALLRTVGTGPVAGRKLSWPMLLQAVAGLHFSSGYQ
jgi:hypothetical protein